MNDSATFKKLVASRLKQARKALGVTQEVLCQRAGMRIPSLRDYELGKTIPGGEALSMLMKAGIAPAWLLTGTGEMFCKPAEATGLAIASAIRDSGLTIDEAVARLGIGIDELLGYLEGRVVPNDTFLARLADLTGYPLDKLIAARNIGDAIAQIDVMHARVTSQVKEDVEKEATKMYMTASEPAPDQDFGQINQALMQNCLRACQEVHGEPFKAMTALEQLDYTINLYNLIAKMTREVGSSPKSALRLEVTGLAEQLRLFLRMEWAKRFIPKPDLSKPPFNRVI